MDQTQSRGYKKSWQKTKKLNKVYKAKDSCLVKMTILERAFELSSSRMMIEQHTAGVYISHFVAVAYEVWWAYIGLEVW
jgi:hypothetical protein